MTGKLLKDPEVSQEEEDNVAISEVSMHSLPCLPIFGTPIFPQGKALSVDGLVAKLCHYSGSGALTIRHWLHQGSHPFFMSPSQQSMPRDKCNKNAFHMPQNDFKECAHFYDMFPRIPRPPPTYIHTAQSPRCFSNKLPGT